MAIIDITGQRYGRLVALSVAPRPFGSSKSCHWLFRCDCGSEVVRSSNVVRRANKGTKSCGCLNAEMQSVRGANRRARLPADIKLRRKLRTKWRSIKFRCENPLADDYVLYGKRGIKVCDQWQDFEAFYAWACQTGFVPGDTIDRIDVNGNYSPDNCRWATPKQQARNKRTNRYITFEGVTLSMAEWADKLGVRYALFNSRASKGWPDDKIIGQPIRKGYEARYRR